MAIPVSPDTAKYREQLAESYGFKQIGEPLPDNVTLNDVIYTLPKEVLSSLWKKSHSSFNLSILLFVKIIHLYRILHLLAMEFPVQLSLFK